MGHEPAESMSARDMLRRRREDPSLFLLSSGGKRNASVVLAEGRVFQTADDLGLAFDADDAINLPSANKHQEGRKILDFVPGRGAPIRLDFHSCESDATFPLGGQLARDQRQDPALRTPRRPEFDDDRTFGVLDEPHERDVRHLQDPAVTGRARLASFAPVSAGRGYIGGRKIRVSFPRGPRLMPGTD